MKRLLDFNGFKLNEDKAMDNLLKKGNPRYPKIPVENVFLNPNPFAQDPDGDLMKKLNPWNTLELMDKNVDRSELPVEDIKIEDLVPTQKYLNADNIDDVEDSLDDEVLKSTISKYEGKYYILDGHHRIARRILRGDETIPSHVYYVEDSSNVYIGYHASNNPESILKNGFDEDMISTAFSGRGFYFSTDPKNLKGFNRNGIIKARIKLNTPLTDRKVWEDAVHKLSKGTPDLDKIAKDLRDVFEKAGYDGILMFNEYGWWDDVKWHKDDEILVFRSKNIIPLKIV